MSVAESPVALAPAALAAAPYRWVILAVVVASQVLASGFYLLWPAITPFLRTDFDLTREQVGLIVGAVAAGSTVASAPFGQLGDRIGARWPIAAGLAAMALVALLVAASPSFVLLLASIFAAGLAYGAVNPNGIKALVPWFARREMGTAIGVKSIGGPLAGGVAAATLPALTLALGTWRLPIAAFGGVIAAGALATLVLLRDRPSVRARAPATGGSWWAAVRRRNVVLICAGGFLYASTQGTWLGHFVLYSHDELRLPVTVGAGFLALVQIASVAGRILLGLASDRLFGGRRRELLVACGLVSATILGTLPLVGLPPFWLLSLVAITFGLTGISWGTLQLALLAEEGGDRSSGVLVGMGMTFAHAGMAVAPPLFGRAVDTLGTYGPAWQGLALAGLVGVLLVALVRERPAGELGVIEKR